MARNLLPEKESIDPKVTKAAQALFVGYTLYQVDTLHYPDYSFGCTLSLIDSDDFPILTKNIQRMLKNKLHVQFLMPTQMDEGTLYLSFDETIDAIRYAVMKSGRCIRGIISDTVYDHFKQKLKKTGQLALSEVNFFIEKIIVPRRHLKRNTEVIDRLCRDALMYFLTVDPETQISAVRRMMTLIHPFGDAIVTDNNEEGFFHVWSFWKNAEIIEEQLFTLNHWKKYFCSRQLMTVQAEYEYEGELYQARIDKEQEDAESVDMER